MLFRTRALFVRQSTQTINSLRGHLAEFGLVAPQEAGNAAALHGELFARRWPGPARTCKCGLTKNME